MMTEDVPARSRLPDDAGYWENLARRSTAAAFAGQPPVQLHRTPWWHSLSQAAAVLAAAAALSIVGGVLLLGPRATSSSGPRSITAALAPEDPLLGLLVGVPGEPPREALLGLIVARQAER